MDENFRELAQPRIVDGYQLLRKIGAGGMSAVYEAISPDGTHVALKLLHPSFADTQSARRRLRREVAMLQRVHGNHVAQILDAELDGENLFIVTELIDGPTLEADVREEGRYTEEDLLQLGEKLAVALRSIHQAGVLHRDLKPSNVMMRNGEPVLIDFGISQTGADTRLTQTGFLTHTPGFCDPRVLLGGEPDHAADWWAMAAVLAYAATGEFPFGQGLPAVVMNRVLNQPPHLPHLDRQLQELLARALAPDLAARLAYPDLLAGIANPATGAQLLAEFRDSQNAGTGGDVDGNSMDGSGGSLLEVGAGDGVRDDSASSSAEDSAKTAILPPPSVSAPVVDQFALAGATTDFAANQDFADELRTLQLAQPDICGTDFDHTADREHFADAAGFEDFAAQTDFATEQLPAPTLISPAAVTPPFRSVSAPAPLPESFAPNSESFVPNLAQENRFAADNFPTPWSSRENGAGLAEFPSAVGGYFVKPLKTYPLVLILLAAILAVCGATAPVTWLLAVMLIGMVFGTAGSTYEKLIARRIRRGRAGSSDFGAMLARLPGSLFSGIWRSAVSGLVGLLSGAALYFVLDYNSGAADAATSAVVFDVDSGQNLLQQLFASFSNLLVSPAFLGFLLALFGYWFFPTSRTIRTGLQVTLQRIIPSAAFYIFWVILLGVALAFVLWASSAAGSPTLWPLLSVN